MYLVTYLLRMAIDERQSCHTVELGQFRMHSTLISQLYSGCCSQVTKYDFTVQQGMYNN